MQYAAPIQAKIRRRAAVATRRKHSVIARIMRYLFMETANNKLILLRKCCCAWLLLTLSWGSHGQERLVLNQAINIGAYFSEGDYGEPLDTRITYLPLSYNLDVGKWGFQVLVPHLRVEGLGNVLVNIGGVSRAVAATQTRTSSGIGDTIATLIYRVDPLTASAPFIELRLDVKLPTADEENSLGTGEADYSIQVDLSQNVGDTVVFATLGHNFRGSSTLYEGLQDSSFLQLGIAYPLSQQLSVGAFYDFREPATSFTPETHEVVPYLTWQFNENWSFTAMTIWGFTDASADSTVFGQLSYRW